ncbi:hypothetical protein D3C83_287810 [compost metagenome]
MRDEAKVRGEIDSPDGEHALEHAVENTPAEEDDCEAHQEADHETDHLVLGER